MQPCWCALCFINKQVVRALISSLREEKLVITSRVWTTAAVAVAVDVVVVVVCITSRVVSRFKRFGGIVATFAFTR